ncbi:MAG: hypothetical protein FJ253_05885 [Phycisphaerae bacterium]|nr:hypothetical protein [Phycisphaerae bacterium]
MPSLSSTVSLSAPRSRHANLVLLDGVMLALVGVLLLVGVMLPRPSLIAAMIQGVGFFLVLVGAVGMVSAFRLHEAGLRSLLLFVGPFLALLLGFGAIFAPEIAAESAVQVFGALATAGGIFQIVAALSLPGREHWGLLLVNGVLTLGAGLVMIFSPGIAFMVMMIFFGVQLLFLGAHRIRAALRLRRLLR